MSDAESDEEMDAAFEGIEDEAAGDGAADTGEDAVVGEETVYLEKGLPDGAGAAESPESGQGGEAGSLGATGPGDRVEGEELGSLQESDASGGFSSDASGDEGAGDSSEGAGHEDGPAGEAG